MAVESSDSRDLLAFGIAETLPDLRHPRREQREPKHPVAAPPSVVLDDPSAVANEPSNGGVQGFGAIELLHGQIAGCPLDLTADGRPVLLQVEDWKTKGRRPTELLTRPQAPARVTQHDQRVRLFPDLGGVQVIDFLGRALVARAGGRPGDGCVGAETPALRRLLGGLHDRVPDRVAPRVDKLAALLVQVGQRARHVDERRARILVLLAGDRQAELVSIRTHRSAPSAVR